VVSCHHSPKAGLGYGNKSDFTKEYLCERCSGCKSPSPNTYTIGSEFEADQKEGRGYKFGVGRQEMEVTGLFRAAKEKSPGPGAYELKAALPEARSFSMRGK
jgi:hypothetical protein